MKVVQVLPDLNSGGVERGTLEVAQALVSAGHQSLVVSAGGSLQASLTAQGSSHVTWDLGRKSPLTLRHVLPLRRWLHAQRPDILHLRSRLPAWIGWLAWRGLPMATRPRLVTTVHGLYSVSRYSAIMCRGERVIAVSKTVEDYIRQHYPDTPDRRIVRIYRGVDPAQFPYDHQPDTGWLARWQQQYPNLQGKRLLTLPGRLTRLKGQHDFIALIGQLKTQHPDLPIHGLIVGGEDPKRQAYAQELYQAVQHAGLNEDITFTGNRTDIREIYAISELVLSLSAKPEAFGRTVLEALTLGVPVIGYDHGGVGELLAELFPPGQVPLQQPAALLTAVQRQLHHPQRPTPGNRFTRQAMLHQTLELYHHLVTQESRNAHL